MANEIITQKACSVCHSVKPLAEFSPQRLGKHGTTASCKVCRRELTSIWRKANPAKVQDSSRKEYQKNKDARRARRKAWAKKNPEMANAQQQRYYYKNRESVLRRHKIAGKKYAQQNRPKMREIVMRRYRRIKDAAGFYSFEQWLAKGAYHGWRCYLCGLELSPLSAETDHKIPVSRGGTNWLANIAPVCTPCNMSKGAKTTTEYLAFREQISRKFH